jgi:hypothetical protein
MISRLWIIRKRMANGCEGVSSHLRGGPERMTQCGRLGLKRALRAAVDHSAGRRTNAVGGDRERRFSGAGTGSGLVPSKHHRR